MQAVLIHSTAVTFVDVLLFALVLALVGALPLIESKRGQVALWSMVIVVLVAVSAGVAAAIPVKYCDPLWRWMGWC